MFPCQSIDWRPIFSDLFLSTILKFLFDSTSKFSFVIVSLKLSQEFDAKCFIVVARATVPGLCFVVIINGRWNGKWSSGRSMKSSGLLFKWLYIHQIERKNLIRWLQSLTIKSPPKSVIILSSGRCLFSVYILINIIISRQQLRVERRSNDRHINTVQLKEEGFQLLTTGFVNRLSKECITQVDGIKNFDTCYTVTELPFTNVISFSGMRF